MFFASCLKISVNDLLLQLLPVTMYRQHFDQMSFILQEAPELEQQKN